MNRRSVLTEIGPDAGALRAAIARRCCSISASARCRSTSACACRSAVRRAASRALRAPGRSRNPAMGVILAASPHRVFISRLGRIEVCQPIPPPDGRARKARTPMCCRPAAAPAHPCGDRADPGRPGPVRARLSRRIPPRMARRGRPFDRARHDAFQAMLRMFRRPGPRRAQAAGVRGGRRRRGPVGRRGHRPSLCAHQRSRGAPPASSDAQETPALAAWMAAHERGHGETVQTIRTTTMRHTAP